MVKKLKTIRLSLNKSQNEMASDLETSQQNYNRWEQSDSLPDEKKKVLALKFNVNMNWFVADIGQAYLDEQTEVKAPAQVVSESPAKYLIQQNDMLKDIGISDNQDYEELKKLINEITIFSLKRQARLIKKAN